MNSRKFVALKHFPRKGTADFVGCAQAGAGPLFALNQSEDVGKQEFSSNVCAATNVAATRSAATNSIRILPRLL